MKAEERKTKVLLLGVEEATEVCLSSLLVSCDVTRMPLTMDAILEPLKETPQLVVVGPSPPDVPATEVAQAMRMHYQHAPIYYTCHKREGYDRNVIIKNGFSDTFLLPIDADFLLRNIRELISKTKGMVTYRPVKLIDIEPGSTLDFDTTIYLPANNKYIKYSSAGDPIEEDRVKKLKAHNMSSVYVDTNQMQKFYDYTAQRLASIGKSNQLSESQKKEKMEESVRHLMSNLFVDSDKEATFEQGQSLVQDCQKIVSGFIMNTASNDWYQKIINAMGDLANSYCHATNVSTFASMFSMALGIGKPEDLAVAGLLHDIGLVDVPSEILMKKVEDMTSEGRALYQQHPEFSVNIIKKKKLIVSEKVMKIILQHHEAFNGSGYPRGLTGDRIMPEAQLLALADKFDELTSVETGRALMSAREAIQYFRQQVMDNPGNMIFDPEILKKILLIFPSDEQSTKAA